MKKLCQKWKIKKRLANATKNIMRAHTIFRVNHSPCSCQIALWRAETPSFCSAVRCRCVQCSRVFGRAPVTHLCAHSKFRSFLPETAILSWTGFWRFELKGDAEKTDTGYDSVMKFIYQVYQVYQVSSIFFQFLKILPRFLLFSLCLFGLGVRGHPDTHARRP